MKNFTATPFFTVSPVVFIFLAFLTPSTLVFNFLPGESNPFVLLFALVIAGAFTFMKIRRGHWAKEDLGFPKVKLSWSEWTVFLSMMILTCVGFVYVYDEGKRVDLSKWTVLFSFIYSTAQVFLYQCFLMKLGKDVFKTDYINIPVNVALYVYMHRFYDLNNKEYLLLTVAGLLFCFTYRLTRGNAWPVIWLHFPTNLLALRMGMF